MGPFDGRFLQVSTGILDGSRPSTRRSVQIDTRRMSQWMESMHYCGVSIKNVSSVSINHSSTDSAVKQKSEKEHENVKKTTSSISVHKQKEKIDVASGQSDERNKVKKRRNRRKPTA